MTHNETTRTVNGNRLTTMDTNMVLRTHIQRKQSVRRRTSQTIKIKMIARTMTKMIKISTCDIRGFLMKWMLLYLKHR